MSVRADLSTVPVTALCSENISVVTVDSSTPLPNVLKVLGAKNIYSVPVVDSRDATKYVGLIEVGDVVAELVAVYQSVNLNEATTDIHQLVSLVESKWKALTVEKLLSNPNRFSPFASISLNTATVQDAINALAQSGRRVPVVNDANQIVGIISPWTIVQFLHSHMHLLGDNAKKTVKEINRYSHKPVVVDSTTRAFDAFSKMIEHGISGLGIQSKDGHEIMAIVSIKDIRVASENFLTLFAPIDEYIQIVRRANLRAIAPSIYCSINDPLEKVLAKIAAIRMHRVFLHGDDQHSTVGVLSVWDIVSLFVQ